jgi:2-methylcitrate dehydratase PrpD
MPLTRRRFIQLSAANAAALSAGNSWSQAAESRPESNPQPDPGHPTRDLARFLAKTRLEDIPTGVRKETARTVLNWVGVAVGGAQHETVTRVLAALQPFAGAAQAQIVGRKERTDVMSASLVNGISSHVLDFDDTHLKTIIHISSVVVPPALALAEHLPSVTGAQFLRAILLGGEVALRSGNAVYPDHYDAGWHITGTAGVLGSAATAGLLLGLNEQQLIWALGLAASQSVGLRESFGSMNKSFNPGRAAQNGLLAAFLAKEGFTSSDQMLEAKRGWANTVSTKRDFREITGGLGTRFEMALNTYKPFACGIVIHPVIDGCIQLRGSGLTTDDIAKVELRVHPLVLELTGKTAPRDELEGKFSVYHAAAIALLQGRAGPKQFSDAAVQAPATVALRQKVTAIVDPAIKESQADVTLTLRDGTKRHVFVTQAVGSVENPMTDRMLTDKVTDLMDGILPAARIKEVIQACWDIEKMPEAAQLGRLLQSA